MKCLSLLFCVSLLAVTAPVTTARADVAVSVDFFYDSLSPYGDWVYTDNYGYVWQPAIAQQNNWSPYSDGYWAYTDAGWTWISNEDFGWATYHYGRWIRMSSNWYWVPGNEWAPAWVSWRQTDDYVGWAPLPPEARWNNDIGFSSWTDSYYDIGPSYYSFVPVASFASRSSLRPVIVDRSRNVSFIDRSVNITNITYRQNIVNNIFVGGPDPARLDRMGGGNRIRRLTLRRDEDSFRRGWLDNRDGGRGPQGRGDFNSISRIENDQLIVAAPSVRRENAPSLPPRVRERIERPEVDRGWRNLGDGADAERLRNRQREELAKAQNGKLPEKTPNIVTAQKPPPAVGRQLKPEERNLVERPAPGKVDEEVRKAEPKPMPGPTGRPAVVDQPPARPGAPGAERDVPGGRRPESGRPNNPERADNRPGMDREPGDRRPPTMPGKGPSERGNRDDKVTNGPRGNDFRPVPPGVVPNEGGDRRRGGMPDRPETPPTNPEPRATPPKGGEERGPQRPGTLTPPGTPSAPMPEARPEQRGRPSGSMPRPEPRATPPAPMPKPMPPSARPMPQERPQQPQARPERPQPQARPSAPERPQPQARPSGPPQGGGEGGGRGPRGPGGPGGGGDRGGREERKGR